jgi:hypothetical protein
MKRRELLRRLSRHSRLAYALRRGYFTVVTVKAIVDGKVVRLKLSPGLAQAWRQNRGKTMTEKQAVEFVERTRRQHAPIDPDYCD